MTTNKPDLFLMRMLPTNKPSAEGRGDGPMLSRLTFVELVDEMRKALDWHEQQACMADAQGYEESILYHDVRIAGLTRLLASPPHPEGEDLLGALTAALSVYDAACHECPGSGGRALPDKCPRCFATSSQGCGVEVRASAQFIEAVRAKLEAKP